MKNHNQYVYITDNAAVYHTNANCTHLDLSVSKANISNVATLRNTSGGKYHKCTRCNAKGITSNSVYITKTGNYYHTSRSCSGIRRSIYCVPLDEVIGKGVCSRCGGS